MRRKTRTSRRQVMLLPPIAQNDSVAAEAKRELVQALADLLLQALQVKPSEIGGRDDEHESHA